jgi:hypothetical protein
MTKKDLNNWYTLRIQFINGYHMEPWEWQELIRLNHLVMEATHDIHNKNMLKKD